MKAVQVSDHGGYEALRLVNIPRPQPGSDQALVRVSSAGVTPLDWYVLGGLLPTAKPPPVVLGNEGAGVVVADPTKRFATGTRVLFFAGSGGVTQDGTWAEYALVPAGNLALLPDGLSDEVAGGLPIAYLSAFLALRQAGFAKGQSVLAPGVGGSVGNATLKVAQALGASRLLSTAGSSTKERAAGDDPSLQRVDIVNLEHESLAEGLARLAPDGVDVVIDSVGGSLTGQAVGGLAPSGRLVAMGYAAGTETKLRVTDLVWKRGVLSGFSLFAATPDQQSEAYETILPLIARGDIGPSHERTFRLDQAPEAMRHLIEDRPYGKVTLVPIDAADGDNRSGPS